MTLIGARVMVQKRGSIPSRIPRCSFSSRIARSTASTMLSVALPPPALELPVARAIAAPPTPPNVRGAFAAWRDTEYGAGPAGVRATLAGGGGVGAPVGGGKEISMKSGPLLTSAPAAAAAAARSAVGRGETAAGGAGAAARGRRARLRGGAGRERRPD